MLLCQECIYLYILLDEKVIYLHIDAMQTDGIQSSLCSINKPMLFFFAFTFNLNYILNATICTAIWLSKACCS